MQVAVWIIIILVIIFLIWLLRRWIRRIIFILILLALAFLIYGIFNPSGAARLWYNVRTFPQRMAGWMGSAEEFLDYDKYKSTISSIGDKIGDKIDIDTDIEIPDVDIDITSDDEIEGDTIQVDDEKEKSEEKIEEAPKTSGGQTIRSFPKPTKFVEVPHLEQASTDSELSGYSKSDLFGIINTYIEKNLDDDTDILVTVEYEDDSNDPQKIILETQQR